MRNAMIRLPLYTAIPLLAVGCGNFQETVAEAMQEAAKQAIQNEIEEIISELADQLAGEFDLSDVIPVEAEDEPEAE